MKFLRLLLWSIIASALIGLAIGTLIRTRLEAPRYYIGAVRSDSALAAVPLHVVDVGAAIFHPGHHEEQVR